MSHQNRGDSRLILCEPVCRGAEHATFNAALIATVQAAYASAPLHFYGEATHLQAVRAALAKEVESHILWHPLTVPPRQRSGVLQRLPQEVRFWRRLLNHAAYREAGCLIGCSSTAASILALKWLLPRAHYQGRVLLLLHSLLGEITRRRRNPLAHILSLRRILSHANREQLRYVVLADAIQTGANAAMPQLTSYLHALPFPYQFYTGTPKILNRDRPIRFAFLGVGSREKGFDWLTRLATEISQKFPGRAEFHLIGQLHMALTPVEQESITIHADNAMLSRDNFDSIAMTMDYSILLHDPDFYRLIASGTIMDALLFGLPVIARRSSASASYFHVMGDIGYFIDDYEQLFKRVAAIIENPPVAQYTAQSERIIAEREQFSPASLANVLRAIAET